MRLTVASWHYCLFVTHAHLIQYRFHLFFRYPVLFPKDITETPVRSLHNVMFYLLCECALDLVKGYILSINCDAPEAIGSYPRG